MVSRCTGPCLKHCYKCSTPTAALAYLSLGYLMTTVFYLILTRGCPTPFADSLTDEQKRIKARASRQRGTVFLLGVVLSASVLLLSRPLRVSSSPSNP